MGVPDEPETRTGVSGGPPRARADHRPPHGGYSRLPRRPKLLLMPRPHGAPDRGPGAGGATHDGGPGRPGAEGWRVRLRSAGSGRPLGSGVLLGGTHVLTCAHVPGDRGATVLVDFPEIAGAASSEATVAPDGWHPAPRVPRQEEPTADLALLEVHRPPPGGRSAPLLRAAPPAGTPVEICGLVADGLGAALRATVSRRFGERVQLYPESLEHVPRRGFSGGPVLDMQQPTGVLGIAVTRYVDRSDVAPLALAQMIPVDTVLRYLPQVERWTGGRPGVATSIAARASAARLTDPEYAVRLTRWLDGSNPAPVYVTTVVPGTSRDQTLQRTLALADRELSTDAPSVRSQDPAGTVPPVGSLDLAVDAAGASAAEVVREIAERLNLRETDPRRARRRLRALPLSQTVAVLGVDRAARPAELIDLCGDLAQRGARHLLVFHGVPGTGRGGAPRSAEASVLLRHRIGRLEDRLARLADRAAALPGTLAAAVPAAREAAPSEAAPSEAAPSDAVPSDAVPSGAWPGGGEPPARTLAEEAARLRTQLAGLHGAARRADGPPPARLLRRAEPELAAAVERAERLLATAERAAGRLRELRGELETYRRLAAHLLGAEDVELAPRYREARDALYAAPFDPRRAAAATERYRTAVRAALGWPADPADPPDPADTPDRAGGAARRGEPPESPEPPEPPAFAESPEPPDAPGAPEGGR